jgi:hypothetical protein
MKYGKTLWKDFFESFRLTVYFIGDLDSAFGFIYSTETAYKLHNPEIIAGFKCTHQNLTTDIEQKKVAGIYILKERALEHYLGIHNKGLAETIKFCNDNFTTPDSADFVMSPDCHSLIILL